LLQTEQLCFGFTNRPLIDQLNLRLNSGEIALILGPNGTGKSTLMSLLAGLRLPTSGSVRFSRDEGKSFEFEPGAFCEYLPAENNGHFLRLDAESNLVFWHQLRNARKPSAQELDHVLSTWRLNHILVRRGLAVDKFSTGMKRRLAMARLELNQAPIWLLDEPLFGLDQEGIAHLVQAILRHQSRGGISLIISHEIQALSKLNCRTIDSSTFRSGDRRS
jgi:heme exporter protein A